jgi:hypothetical protein
MHFTAVNIPDDRIFRPDETLVVEFRTSIKAEVNNLLVLAAALYVMIELSLLAILAQEFKIDLAVIGLAPGPGINKEG